MQVVTILGNNQGNKYEIIQEAIQILTTAGQIVMASSFYETEPWGFECDENFLNRVVVYETGLSPKEFLEKCLDTEKRLGRQRHTDSPRYSSRPIDIDLLFYDSLILDSPELILPHPRLAQRNFVLTPLAEIMPGFIHPVLHKTIAELLSECPDKSMVKKITMNAR